MKKDGSFFVPLLLAACATIPATAHEVQLEPEALAQIAALQQEKAARTPVQLKIDSNLLLALKQRRADPILHALPELRPAVEIDEGGTVLVDIEVDMSEGLLREIEARGYTVIDSHPALRALRARVPLAELERLAAAPEVAFIRPASHAILSKINTSQGDVAHTANLARTTFGVDGTGVTVCVLADGIDSRATRISTGDLPDPVGFLTGQAGSGDEGTAMLEIIFDLAPGASLIFATGHPSAAQMATNILGLLIVGCEIIVDAVTYTQMGAFQDDIIAQAVETAAANGALYFSAASNSGNLNDDTSGLWEGDFNDVDGDGFHNFTPENNVISEANTISGGVPGRYTLKWSDPLDGSSNDYDLLLMSPDLHFIWGSSSNPQTGSQDPFEAISALGAADVNAKLMIIRNDGAADRFLRLNTHGGELDYETEGQVFGHSAAASTFAVAAVDVDQAAGGTFDGTETVETFSADGPRRVFFEADGTAITPGDFSSSGGALRQKPDIATADGVVTSTPAYLVFHGTSAAAPHAAAIAALMLEESALTRDGLEMVWAATSLDIEATGFDRDSGHGLLLARDAVGTVAKSAPDCYVDTLEISAIPNDGPATFRACQRITWGPGTFDDVTGIAATHIFTDGFESGNVSAWRNMP